MSDKLTFNEFDLCAVGKDQDGNVLFALDAVKIEQIKTALQPVPEGKALFALDREQQEALGLHMKGEMSKPAPVVDYCDGRYAYRWQHIIYRRLIWQAV